MPRRQWWREERALAESNGRALVRWQTRTEKLTGCDIRVCERTFLWLVEEAERITAARKGNGVKGDPVWPGDIVDDIVRRLQRQLVLPYISKRKYDNRRRRGW